MNEHGYQFENYPYGAVDSKKGVIEYVIFYIKNKHLNNIIIVY